MDGLFHGKPYEQMDDLGGFHPYFWFNTHIQKSCLTLIIPQEWQKNVRIHRFCSMVFPLGTPERVEGFMTSFIGVRHAVLLGHPKRNDHSHSIAGSIIKNILQYPLSSWERVHIPHMKKKKIEFFPGNFHLDREWC